MIVWVLLLVSGLKTDKVQIFVNTFDSKAKCEQRIKEMEPMQVMECIKTTVNK